MKCFFYTFIYDGITYEDRLLMSIEESKLLSNYYIISSKSNVYHDNLILLESKSYIDFCFKCIKFIKEKKEKIIFNEHNSFFILLLSKIKRMNTINIYNLYSLDIQFFIQRGWLEDNNSKISFYHNIVSFKKAFKSFLERIVAIISSDLVISNNPCLKKELIFFKKKTVFINSSISINKYNEANLKSYNFHFNNNYKYILYVGNINPEKGLATLIKTYSLLNKTNEYKLILIGNSSSHEIKWLKSTLKRYNVTDANYLGKIEHNQLKWFYKNSSIFVLPSFYEGSPRVLKEAMCFSNNIIASKIPGNLILDVNQERIKFFTKGDSDDLLNKILELEKVNHIYDKHFVNKFDSKQIAKDRIKILKDNEFIS